MKRLIVLLLICLLLAGCATDPLPKPEQKPPAAVEESPAEALPVPEKEPEAVPEYDSSKPVTGVYVDTSKLTAFEPPEEIFTRYYEAFTEELIPGDYGLLRPYYGSRAAFDMTIYGGQDIMNGAMGLIDESGAIVVDPVYNSIDLMYDRSIGKAAPFYSLAKETWAEEEWGSWMSRRYGVCSLDGSMSIPCDYEAVACYGDKIAALKNADEGILHVYDTDGALLLDTAFWENRPRISYSDGMGAMEVTDHLIFLSVMDDRADSWDIHFALYDWQGNLISDQYDWVDISGEAPYPCGNWESRENAYLDEYGRVILQGLGQAGSFRGGQAVAEINGVLQVIDPDGNRLWEPPAWPVYTIPTDTGYFYNCTQEINGITKDRYFDSSFQELFPEAERVCHLDGDRFLVWQNGICSLWAGSRSVILEGAEDYNRNYYSYNYDVEDKILIQCFLQEQREYWLLDSELNLLSSGKLENEGVELLADRLTGDSVAVHYSTTGYYYPYDFYVLEYPGAPKLEDVRVLDVYSGWYMVEDDFSSGYMDAEGNWLLRVSLMTDMVD